MAGFKIKSKTEKQPKKQLNEQITTKKPKLFGKKKPIELTDVAETQSTDFPVYEETDSIYNYVQDTGESISDSTNSNTYIKCEDVFENARTDYNTISNKNHEKITNYGHQNDIKFNLINNSIKSVINVTKEYSLLKANSGLLNESVEIKKKVEVDIL